MKKIAVALVVAGSLCVAGQASAHGHGGDIVGALIGGAVLGAVVTSALNPAPVVAYQQPVYAQPAYQPAPVYAGPPPGFTVTFTAIGGQVPDGDLTVNSFGVKTPAEKW